MRTKYSSADDRTIGRKPTRVTCAQTTAGNSLRWNDMQEMNLMLIGPLTVHKPIRLLFNVFAILTQPTTYRRTNQIRILYHMGNNPSLKWCVNKSFTIFHILSCDTLYCRCCRRDNPTLSSSFLLRRGEPSILRCSQNKRRNATHRKINTRI